MSVITSQDLPCEVKLVRNKRARRFTLRLDKHGPGAVLTVPLSGPEHECHSFLVRHSDWLTRTLAKQPPTVDVCPGAEIPVDGELLRIVASEGRRGPTSVDGTQLIVRGGGSVGVRVAAWLKERARARLNPAARGYAQALDREVKAVALRDTTSRWGSCSRNGTLSFSWRLAMAPVDVQEYVAAHEAAHLVEMNHSDRFWATVERLMPDWRVHRDWLRREGPGLHAYRFDRS